MALAKYALLPFIAYFFYSAVIHEMAFLGKNILDAFTSSTLNWIFLIFLVAVELVVLLRSEKHKVEIEAVALKEAKSNPFLGGKRKSATSEIFTKKSFFETFINAELYKRVFLKVKRVFYGLLCIFYLAMALTSINNLLFFFVFAFTAYALIENLLWFRAYSWAKKRRKSGEK